MGNRHHNYENEKSKTKHVSRRALKQRVRELERELQSDRKGQTGRRSRSRSRSPSRYSRSLSHSRRLSSSASPSRRRRISTDRDLYSSTVASRYTRDRDLNSPATSRLYTGDTHGETAPTANARSSNIPTPSASPDQDVLLINDDNLDLEGGEGELALTQEVLQILGDDPTVNKTQSYTLQKAVSSRWSYILSHGLNKEQTDELLPRHTPPDNCQLLRPPKINPEFEAIMTQAYLNRDKCHANFQDLLSRGLSAVGKAMNCILLHSLGESDNTNTNNEVLPYLVDAGRIFTNLFYNISITRRNLITQTCGKSVKDTAVKTEPGEFLFGDDFGERMKATKNLERSAKDIRPTTSYSYSNKFNQKNGGRKEHIGTNSDANSVPRTASLNRQRPPRSGRVTRPRGQTTITSRKDTSFWKDRTYQQRRR